MNFADTLGERGYTPNGDAVFMRPDYGGIAYSDGDAVEERIAAIVREAGDISCFSSELARRCTDWPSRYHLSANRGNILRPFRARLKGADVLEIGAGCGAITRFLGESGANVLALEGSPRRAAIARSRTRDLGNVVVLAERFDRFQWAGRFDVVTLIGVLEYAAMFGDGDDPALAMLTRVRELLKPGGRLILAIENRFGLKYFAGAPEDHTGRAMDGIEGRYEAKGPRTWSRKELRELLARAGFAGQNWYAPFPDYKLPVSIVSEAGLDCPDFDSAAFAWQSARRDPQLPQYLHFAPELAWPGLFAAGLALDLSNSFLVLAGAEDADADPATLAWHYSVNDRRAAFCKETVFRKRADGSIGLLYAPLGPDGAWEAEGELVRFHIPREGEYIRGETPAARFVRIVARNGWTFEEAGGFFKEYIEVIDSLLAAERDAAPPASLDALIPGSYYDVIPQNVMVAADGKRHVFDREWLSKKDIPYGLLLFRALFTLVASVGQFGSRSEAGDGTVLDFFLQTFRIAGFPTDQAQLDAYSALDSEIMSDIAGTPVAVIWRPLEHLHTRSAAGPGDPKGACEAGQQMLRREKHASDSEVARRRLVAAHAWEPWRSSGAVAWREIDSQPQPASRAGGIKKRLCALIDRCDGERRGQARTLSRLLESVPLFDREYYLANDADLRRSGIDPVRHYFLHGAAEGRNPSPYFFTAWYLAEYPDVAASGLNPLLHYLQFGVAEGRNPNPCFRTRWYVENTPGARTGDTHPLLHYIRQGYREGARPNPYFDPQWYAATYLAEQRDAEPLADFLAQSPESCRNPNPYFDSAWYAEAYPWTRTMKMHPLQHFIQYGAQEQTEPNPYFDSRWYAQQHPEAGAAGLAPFAHYLAHLGEPGVNPNPFFDAAWYLQAYVDVREKNLDPFLHYLLHGAGEGRDPGPRFSTRWYTQNCPDVQAGGLNPLLHFLTIGRYENRSPHPAWEGGA